jgi:predicted oxidoreductase (fatty acid repression mutant protein)
MKWSYSAFNAQGSRLIIVVVQLGRVRIYVAAVEALRKKETQDETQFATKIDGFLSFIPR